MGQFDLTNKNISDTFQNLLQKTGSEGHLYDLEGNIVDNLTIAGSLTAHSYITSESIVHTSSGSTAFGNSADDTHIFIGNITASGTISASSGISEFDKVLTTGFRIRQPVIGTVHSVIVPHSDPGRAELGDITFTIPGDISASGDYYAGDGIWLGGTKRTTWPEASIGEWALVDTAQTSSLDIIVDGFISASSLELNSVDPTEDFFLLKSGSLDVLKLNGEGVLQLGGFTFTPSAVAGGLYYSDSDNEFYAGKKD